MTNKQKLNAVRRRRTARTLANVKAVLAQL